MQANGRTRTVVKGGTLVDASGERRADVAIEGDEVVEVGTSLVGDRTLDASGCVVSPGFVDLHVHLRQPGREEAETIESGSRAAALGGFTAVVAMPNTEPAQDSLAVIELVRRLGERGRAVRGRARRLHHGRPRRRGARPAGRVGRRRRAPVHRRRQRRAGSRCSCAGRSSTRRGLDITLAQHCEVSRLTEGAVMHEGACCSHLGSSGLAVDRRGADGVPRHRAGPPHRRPPAPAAPVDGAQRRPRPGGEGRRAARHGRGRAAPLHAHRLAAAVVRSRLQGQPAAAHRRPTWPRSSRASRTARSTPSPPTTHRTRRRPRSSRSTRRRRGCSGSRRRSPSPSVSSASTSPRSSPCCRGGRRRSPAWTTATAARSQPGRQANLTVFDPSLTWTGHPGGPRFAQPQHPLRRAQRAGQGAPHGVPRRPGRGRWRCPPMNQHAVVCMIMQSGSGMRSDRRIDP